jgi:formylglycine-generating enzyme required for sulfatase activity
MKSILHSDYWVEIPAGEFFTGLSPENEELIAARMREQFSVDYFPYWKKRLLEDMPRLNLDWKTSYLDKFYISRFQITWDQVTAFHKGAKAVDLPGPLNETKAPDNSSLEYQGGKVAKVTFAEAEALCKNLEARLPSSLEWEKAARGTDDRLYPWGNEWNQDAGYFYRDRPELRQIIDVVDAFPLGVSPYGVYGMLGYIPQLVGIFPWPGARGCDPAETSAERAWLDNIIPIAGKSRGYFSLRPVLDTWPQQQWQGIDFQNNNL